MNYSYEKLQNEAVTPTADGGIFLLDCSSSSVPRVELFIYIRSIMQTLLMFIAILLNITIIAVVCRTKRLHTVPYVFITSLACSDVITAAIIFFCSCIILSSLTAHQTCGLSSSLICFKVFLTFFSVTSNIGNHLLISIERWLYIARPFLHQRIINPRTTTGCLIFMWVIAFAFNINLLIDHCGLVKFSTRVNNGIVKPALHFFLCFIMCVIYSHITFITYRQVKIINKIKLTYGSNEDQIVLKNRALVTRKWTTIRMLVIVFGTYFILVTPSFCMDAYAYAEDHDIYGTLVGKAVNVVWSVHCSLNFFIYAAQDRVFREVLKELLTKTCCVFCRKQVHPETSFSLETFKM